MMGFITMTISITAAILLSGVISIFIMTRPMVLKSYAKILIKSSKHIDKIVEEEMAKDL